MIQIKNEQEYLAVFQETRWLEHGLDKVRKCQAIPDLYPDEAEALSVVETEMKSLHVDYTNAMTDYDLVYQVGRIGNWVLTYTGKRFWLLDPRAEDIDVVDIAHNLSRINRYNGGTLGDLGYSVAQHSVLASTLVPLKYQMAVLMHDAPEAYVGDVVSPLKKLLGGIYTDIEDNIMDAVVEHFRFLYNEDVQKVIKYADEVMLATEVRDVVPFNVIRRKTTESPHPKKIVPWGPNTARNVFLLRYVEIQLQQKVVELLNHAGKGRWQTSEPRSAVTRHDTEKAGG